MKRLNPILVCILLGILFTTCESEEEDGPISVTYEIRSNSCNSYDYGPWEEECTTFDYPRDDWTLADFEALYSGSDIECALNCCINFEYRNAHAFYGTCPN